MINEEGKPIPGAEPIKAMEAMAPRYNGLGAGYAGYGIYPKYKDFYALHIMLNDKESKIAVEDFLKSNVNVEYDEPIPTKEVSGVQDSPIVWRYFVNPGPAGQSSDQALDPDDLIVDLVSRINSGFEGALVFSSGKNMGVFKAVGYPWDVAKFYRIDEYEAYLWLGHGRYPTNTPGWWGGSHPFNIIGWSVVHNGEISSYGTNKRYLEQWGYKCALLTDSEVFAYLFDLLVRRHGLPIEVACKVISPPLWKTIDRTHGDEGKLLQAIRMTYADALVSGPSSIIVAINGMKGILGLTDRLKLRPLVAARKSEMVYIASEECAIRSVCPNSDEAWTLKAGIPLIAKMEGGPS